MAVGKTAILRRSFLGNLGAELKIMIERYSLSPMRELWTLEAQYTRWLEVELAALAALETHGDVPAGTYTAVREKVHVDPDRIARIETEIHHDLLAFIRSLEEQAGTPGRFIHQGLTSSDVKDTALALQMRDGLNLIIAEAEALKRVLTEKAAEYRNLVIVGRTHGMHAEPTTLGLKLINWAAEIARDIDRLRQAQARIGVGKLSGPVGTYSQISPEVEKRALEQLGLRPAPVASQILQRDRHAEVLSAIAITGASLEKISLEIRHLSRTEVSEVEEPQPEGSSSMPHKRNPITAERICGLARVLRANLQAALENIALWHERDISHSSVERVVIPDSFLLVHYMLVKTGQLISGLVVNRDQITENLHLTRGAIYSQAVLLKLVKAGMPRSDAHEAVRQAAERAVREKIDFFAALREDPKVASVLASTKLTEDMLLSRVKEMSARIIEEVRKEIG